MWTYKIGIHKALAVMKCAFGRLPGFAEELGGAVCCLRTGTRIVCLILAALLLLSPVVFAQIKPLQISDFSEGLMAANLPTNTPKGKESLFKYWGKSGYLNVKYEWAIPPQFDWVGPFHEGYALVISGSTRVRYELVKTKKFKVGLAKAQAGGHILFFDGGILAVIDKTGKVLLELPKLAGKLGIKVNWRNSYTNQPIISNVPIYMNSDWATSYRTDRFYFYEGRAVVQFMDGCNYLRKSGDSLAYISSQQFTSCLPFSHGLAGASDSSKKWGFIGMDDNWQIPPRYEEARSYSEGLAAVKTGGLWGAIEKTGAMAIPPKFKNGFSFSEGLAEVDDGKSRYFIDTGGKTAFVLGSEYVLTTFYSFREGLVLGTTQSSYVPGTVETSVFLDRTGKPVFRMGGECSDFSEGKASCWSNDKAHSIIFDKTGKILSKSGNIKAFEDNLKNSPGTIKAAVASEPGF